MLFYLHKYLIKQRGREREGEREKEKGDITINWLLKTLIGPPTKEPNNVFRMKRIGFSFKNARPLFRYFQSIFKQNKN